MFTSDDRILLDFERCSLIMPGPKDWNIENVLGLSAEKYYHRLRGLLDEAGAFQHDPLTMRRIESMIDKVIAVEAVG